MKTIEEFFDKVEPEPNSGCWIWIGARTPDGYGNMKWRGDKTMRAHRFAYEQYVGEIPPNHDIDHVCRRPYCVNPGHLRPLSHRANVLRADGESLPARQLARTHCLVGHPYDAANTYFDGRSRKCRKCGAAAARRYSAKVREAAHA